METRADDMDLTADPLDVVEHVLNAENLPFDRTDDGDLAFSMAGDWRDYELWFAWRPEGDCLQLCCSLDLQANTEQRAASHELISMINQRVWLGHFEVWPEEGEIVFRHALALPHGERPTLAQAASMIDAAMEAADRFFPAFDFLVRGAKSPAEAIDACMFETVGRA
ncbi:YbjN domain-containing protein [Brevundimonas sp. 2R-24]|uniref:YbjN domain-containing protein n=1 Tax=Peiella sedimenti TaxID=3061083 RepID=A0ABT8SMG6_9CAUL|nr:YbjN domain-containing protein [Caulobacteraceae bacterium XZ-24]